MFESELQSDIVNHQEQRPDTSILRIKRLEENVKDPISILLSLKNQTPWKTFGPCLIASKLNCGLIDMAV